MKQAVIEPLSREFFLQPTETVARQLIGKKLIRLFEDGTTLSGMIVETEAYLGAEDPGAHTFNGRRTDRVRSMYLGGGYAYVYFIYGAHYCINVVVGAPDFGQAVLLRALQPLEGIERMQELRGLTKLVQLTNGPGKLCQALAIDRQLDGTTFFGPNLFLTDSGVKPPRGAVKTSARIGLGCRHEAATWPLRYVWADNPYISKKP